MRYVGQVHECTVEIDTFEVTEASLETIKAAFHDRHKQLYTYAERHSAVEVVNVESIVTGHVDKPGRMHVAPGRGAATALKGRRDMVFAADGSTTSTPVYDGDKLGAGDTLVGPAVIEEVTTTIVIEPGWSASLHETGVYVVTADAAPVQRQAAEADAAHV
jgi:N-methylhydantoinase A